MKKKQELVPLDDIIQRIAAIYGVPKNATAIVPWTGGAKNLIYEWETE